jgi:hypothetical protein
MTGAVFTWLSEYIKAEEPVIGRDEVNRQTEALRAMLLNHHNMTVKQFQEAMTVAHFSDLFTDALSRQFYNGYNYAEGSWRDYTFPDTVSDFRDVKRFRMGEMKKLKKRREKQSQRAQGRSLTKVQYGVEEFSEGFDVSWRVILNDDLGAIRETPTAMFRAARRFEDEFVSNLYDNTTFQTTIAALGSPWAGTGRLTEPNLAVGISAMLNRTDADGNKLQIRKIWLVIPTALILTANKILSSAQVAGSANNDANVVNQYIAGVRVDPFMDTSGANIPWMLVADPSEVPGITVVRMTGWNGPAVYKRRSDIEMITGSVPAAFLMGSFDTGDIEYVVEDVIGGWDDASYSGVTDFRGIYWSSGTTP